LFWSGEAVRIFRDVIMSLLSNLASTGASANLRNESVQASRGPFYYQQGL
jgi:hypothetical protein